MKDGKQSDVFVMDFAKAFSNVSHTKLLHKLYMYEIDPETCTWFRSFLCVRIQHVVIDGEESKGMEINLGYSRRSFGENA